jgi:hypothetical protein
LQYELLVDQDTDKPNAPERLERESQYGELQHIFALEIKRCTPRINPGKGDHILLLALIHEAPTKTDTCDEYEVTWYKGKLGTGEVVDVTTIQCAVGRVQDSQRWWIIDGSAGNSFVYPDFTD